MSLITIRSPLLLQQTPPPTPTGLQLVCRLPPFPCPKPCLTRPPPHPPSQMPTDEERAAIMAEYMAGADNDEEPEEDVDALEDDESDGGEFGDEEEEEEPQPNTILKGGLSTFQDKDGKDNLLYSGTWSFVGDEESGGKVSEATPRAHPATTGPSNPAAAVQDVLPPLCALRLHRARRLVPVRGLLHHQERRWVQGQGARDERHHEHHARAWQGGQEVDDQGVRSQPGGSRESEVSAVSEASPKVGGWRPRERRH